MGSRKIEGRRGSRYCPRCPRSPMRADGRVHAHELSRGEWCVVAGRRDRPLRVVGVGKATIVTRGPSRSEKVRIETATGVREFTAASSVERLVAPTAEVFRVDVPGGSDG